MQGEKTMERHLVALHLVEMNIKSNGWAILAKNFQEKNQTKFHYQGFEPIFNKYSFISFQTF